MKVRLTRRAVRDLRDISIFILASNLAAADRVRNALQQAFAILAAILSPVANLLAADDDLRSAAIPT